MFVLAGAGLDSTHSLIRKTFVHSVHFRSTTFDVLYLGTSYVFVHTVQRGRQHIEHGRNATTTYSGFRPTRPHSLLLTSKL